MAPVLALDVRRSSLAEVWTGPWQEESLRSPLGLTAKQLKLLKAAIL